MNIQKQSTVFVDITTNKLRYCSNRTNINTYLSLSGSGSI